MAATLAESTLHSSNHQVSSRIFVGIIVGSVTAGLIGGIWHAGERGCLPTELCQIGKVDVPYEPAHRDPANPLGGLRITTTASSSSITPTNAVVVITK
jgi:hypothetical protein